MLNIGEPHKSTYSGAAGHCAEAELQANGDVIVRDTKNRDAGALRFTTEEWDAFLLGVKAGEFDRN